MEEFTQEGSPQETPVEQSTPSESPSQPTVQASPHALSQGNGQAQPTIAQQIELDKLEKFMWQGKEWSPKQLQKAIMLNSDYTKKTQAMAEERRFIDNLEYDLDNVRKNPALAAQFKTVYPAAYHRYLKFALAEQQKQESSHSQQNNQPSEPASNPKYDALFEDVNRIKQTFYQQEVQAHEAELEATFDVLGKKYPYGDEEAVLARGQSLIDQGHTLNKQTWEALYKASNEKFESKYKQIYSKQVQEQKTMNQKGKDMDAGGGTPGTPPRRFKSIKEASEAAILDESF